MEKKYKFQENMIGYHSDHNSIQEFTEQSLDHIVGDGITDDLNYAGFKISQTAAAEVTLEIGRVFNDGEVYNKEGPTSVNLLPHLPGVTSKVVAIVASTSTIDTNTQPMEFVIDAESGETQSQAVDTETHRLVTISEVVGLESATPLKPQVGAGLVTIGWVTLDNTGVIDIEMNDAQLLPSVKKNNTRLKTLEAWRKSIGQRVETISSDITALANRQSNVADNSITFEMAADIARLKEANELEDGYSSYGADRFLFDDESDTDHVNYLARIEEGIRFSFEAEDDVPINIANQYDDTIKISNAFLLPDYNEVARIVVGDPTDSLPISQYDFQTVEWEQKTIARSQIRYGATKTVCTNHAWWRSGHYDAAKGIFHKDGDAWQYVSNNGKWFRLRHYWYDKWDEVYWAAIKSDHSVAGSMCAQTFLNSQDTWMTKLKLLFDQVGPSGDVTVVLTETLHGKPDMSKALMSVTLSHADIKAAPNWTEIPWPATFLAKGAHYALCFITGGNHYLASTSGENFGQGTFFYSTDGAFFQGDLSKDICFQIDAAQFKATRLEVNLDPLSLSGGMSDIDILAEIAVPDGAELRFEIQPSGGDWTPLDEVISGNHALYGLPALCYFRAVFIGTKDAMPGINLASSNAKIYRPRTTGKHISEPIVLAAPTQDFKVKLLIEEFYEANHNLTMTLDDVTNGSNGIAPATITDKVLGDGDDANHKRIERTFTWTTTELPVATSQVVLVTDFDTTSPLDTFHGSERVHLAF